MNRYYFTKYCNFRYSLSLSLSLCSLSKFQQWTDSTVEFAGRRYDCLGRRLFSPWQTGNNRSRLAGELLDSMGARSSPKFVRSFAFRSPQSGQILSSSPRILCNLADLKRVRGGCIVCMDYRELSRYSYLHLLANFDGIADALTRKLRDFRQQLFEPSKMYLFGFSFGGQLVLEAGRRFGERQIQQIDG